MKVAFGLLLASSMLGACGGDDTGTGDTSITVDSGMDTSVPPMCDTGDTRFFVANVLDIGQASPTGDPMIVAGFNLDGVVSDGMDAEGCLHPDFTSPPPDNEAGVDNQLGPILSAVGSSLDISGSIAENISDGSLLILFEVENLDDPLNDDCVTLNIYLGVLPAGVTMPVDADGDGLIDADQTFDLSPSSLTPSGDPLVSVQAQVTNGRLAAGPVDIRLDLPVADTVLTLEIQTAQVRLTFDADGAISSGIIGGALDVVATLGTIVAIDPSAIPASLACSVLKAQADLQTIAPLPGQGDSCTMDSECMGGLGCKSSLCLPVLAGEGASCTANPDGTDDCMPGLTCNSGAICDPLCDLLGAPCDAVSIGLVFEGVTAVKGVVAP